MRRLVVTIDGPAGAGKSTVAKRLAQVLGYRLLDTGAIYRAVALEAKRRGVAWDDEAGCADIASRLDIDFAFDGERNRVHVGGADVTTDIRVPEISQGASKVSALPGVRQALLGLQRRLARSGGVVAEGRDLGTVVFPTAEAKFFLTASEDVRARRRTDELSATGKSHDLETTRKEMAERDQRDERRTLAPLCPADDAVKVDSSALSIDEVVQTIAQVVKSRARGDSCD